ncbi:hypothetical protein NMG60_11023071 [Bertholletia excelsa]
MHSTNIINTFNINNTRIITLRTIQTLITENPLLFTLQGSQSNQNPPHRWTHNNLFAESADFVLPTRDFGQPTTEFLEFVGGDEPAAVASVAARSQVAEFTGEKTMRQQWQSGLTPHMRGGRRGGRPFRDGNLGHFGARPDGPGPSFHGKGRGRGYGRQFSAPGDKTAVSVRGESSQNKVYPQNTPGWAPPRMAWCELCRVDCNTPEILEQHKNGKKHKKNLQVYEELQKLNKVLTGGQNGQVSVPEVKQEVSQQEKVEGSENKPPEENTSSQTVIDKNEVEERELTEVLGQGHGSKRKMRGGRGVKWMRTQEGSRRPVEPHKPKQVVPFFCELCNVRCDSQVVFQTHLNGKKHLGNLKRFQDQQMMLGQVALQALYPALQALYPALQALYNPNPDASTSFAPQFNQASQGPLPQPMPSVLPPSQVPVLTSTMEEQENKDPGPEQTEATSEAASKDAAVAEAKPQKQPASEELNAQPGVEPLLDTAAGAEQVLSSRGAGQTSEDAS